MKKILILVILIAVLGAVIWKFNVSTTDKNDQKNDDKTSSDKYEDRLHTLHDKRRPFIQYIFIEDIF